LPRFSTLTWVPKGRLRWAAANTPEFICSPLAVLVPMLYQDALPHWLAAASFDWRLAAAQTATKANPNATTRCLIDCTILVFLLQIACIVWLLPSRLTARSFLLRAGSELSGQIRHECGAAITFRHHW
jgi:hypothetical protein